MRKFALVTAAAALALGSIATTTSAEARPGYRGGYNGGYYGGRRGIGTRAAVGLGIAGLAAGAVAAGAANSYYRDSGYGPSYGYRGGYGYGAPAYGYSAPSYGYYGSPY